MLNSNQMCPPHSSKQLQDGVASYPGGLESKSEGEAPETKEALPGVSLFLQLNAVIGNQDVGALWGAMISFERCHKV